MKLPRLASMGWTLAALVVAVGGYRYLQTQAALDTYQQRLGQLQQKHDQLTKLYNDAVRKTAVTELLVEQGKLSVIIRTAEGVRQVIPTSYDPSREIFVDYVVLDGRLWIRRVFDSHTPPGQGLIINPLLEQVDWNDSRFAVGKAVYRSLDEGRWIVTVTGNGSLGLVKQVGKADIELAPPPGIREFEPDQQAPAGNDQRIGPADVLNYLFRSQP